MKPRLWRWQSATPACLRFMNGAACPRLSAQAGPRIYDDLCWEPAGGPRILLFDLLLPKPSADFGKQRVLCRLLTKAHVGAVRIAEAWTVEALPGAPLIIVDLGKVTVGRIRNRLP